jgi:hypothetical protein
LDPLSPTPLGLPLPIMTATNATTTSNVMAVIQMAGRAGRGSCLGPRSGRGALGVEGDLTDGVNRHQVTDRKF